MTRVRGRCPNGCGETLFLGAGGYVTCSWQACPEPGAAATLLEDADVARSFERIFKALWQDERPVLVGTREAGE